MSETAEMTPTEVALARLPEPEKVELAFSLPSGSIDPNGLALPTTEMSYEEWSQIGHYIGRFNRWSRFALGDWLNWGAEAFGGDGDIWAQATEPAPADRYDVANRVTGLKIETLRNYASVCGRIPLAVRRVELGFSDHEPVAALEPEQQAIWLARAVENGWDRAQLRDEIRNEGRPEEDVVVVEASEPVLSVSERIEHAARLVFNQGQPTADGGLLVPPEPVRILAAALGEEE